MILNEIAEKTKKRIAHEKRLHSLKDLKEQVAYMDCEKKFPFEKAIRKEGLSVICEVKKASPSKEIIAHDFPYVEIARQYEAAGADAISVLTEPFYFQGSDNYLREIKKEIKIPLLRKDFTVDEYMIYQAKYIGADAILLICAILSDNQLYEYLQIAKSIGLSALVEVHDEREIAMALKANAQIIGVNNRNLKDFTVNIENSIRLRSLIPAHKLFVSESGMKTSDDMRRLRDNKTDAVLIGETFMKSKDRVNLMRQFRAVSQNGS